VRRQHRRKQDCQGSAGSKHENILSVASIALLLAASGAVASFRGLGDLPGGAFHSEALAVSDDGKVVAGRSASQHSEEEGFLWTAGGGPKEMPGPGGAHVPGEPRAIDASGKVAAGKIFLNGSLEAAHYTKEKGWTLLGDLEGGGTGSQVLGMSADGSVLVGWGTSGSGLEAARWVGGKATAIGDLPGGAFHSAAAAASADGATIAGTGTTERGPEAFLWTASAGIVSLGELEGGEHASEPFGISPDGTTVVGKSSSSRGTEAFRWTKAGGMQALGDLAGGEFMSLAFDVSSAGLVVGTATGEHGPEAFVWDDAHGLRSLRDVLAPFAAGWQLTEAVAITPDGRTIVGNGIDPDGKPEGWVARLP